MTFGSIDSSIGVAALVVAMLLARWLGNRLAGGKADVRLDEPTLRRSALALGATGGGSEEERMRRFLEALGIPADTSDQGQRPATPPPLRPARRREPPMRPSQEERSEPSTSAFPTRQSPIPQYTSGTPSPPVQPPPLVQTVAAAIPALHTRTLEPHEREAKEGFQTITDKAPDPSQGGVLVRRESEPKPRAAGSEIWREALRSPDALRSAIILQEILGPPRSLQSGKWTHNFPSF